MIVGTWRMVMSFCMNILVNNVCILKSSVKANPGKQAASPNAHLLCRKALPLFKFPSYIQKGSMAVEAAMAVPLFLFFVINLLSLIVMYERYSSNLASLHQQAKAASVASGLVSVSGDEMVSLVSPMSITPFINEMGFHGAYTTVTAKCRKWTGYDTAGSTYEEKEDEYVYMTENGSVFHRSRDCSHLKITVQVINPDDLKMARNESGERYKPCEKCGNGATTGLYFVTKQGNRYHNSVNCSGLKRNIKTVKLSDISGVPGCGVCS